MVAQTHHHAYEACRLRALSDYDILDTEAEACFDDIACLAAQVCNTPIALITLIDRDRTWAKSSVGVHVESVPRNLSFCDHAIRQHGIFLVPNAAEDNRFKDFASVTTDPGVRFYAGSTLISPDGYELGTLCVVDFVPRSLDDGQQTALQRLGEQVVAQLELRRVRRQLDTARLENQNMRNQLTEVNGDVESLVRARTAWLAQMNAGLQKQLTEQHEIIRPEQAELERIIAGSPDCIKIIDRDGRLQWMSDGGLTVMDVCDLKTLVGKKWVDIWPQDERESVSEALESALTGRTQRFEGFCPTAKGRPKWWDVIIKPLESANGVSDKLIAISRDITDRRQVEIGLRDQLQKLRLINVRKTESLASIASRLRKPLKKIRQHIGISVDDSVRSSLSGQEEESLVEQIGELEGLVNDLYDVSRLKCNTLNLHRKYVSLVDDVISPALNKVAAIFRERNHRFNINAKSAQINVDPQRLSQAISRLLDNAARHAQKQSSIKLSAWCDGSRCQINIQYNCTGTFDDMSGRVFNSVVPLEDDICGMSHGFEAGLAIARNIVELHGGKLLETGSVSDSGCEFVITLPITQIEKKSITHSPGDNESKDQDQGSDLRILIVNENSSISDALVAHLLRMGHHVETVSDEKEAIEAIYRNDVQIALFDINSQRAADIEMARIVRSEFSRNKTFRMIALLGDQDGLKFRKNTREIENDDLFDGCLASPLTADKLEEAIQLLDASIH